MFVFKQDANPWVKVVLLGKSCVCDPPSWVEVGFTLESTLSYIIRSKRRTAFHLRLINPLRVSA